MLVGVSQPGSGRTQCQPTGPSQSSPDSGPDASGSARTHVGVEGTDLRTASSRSHARSRAPAASRQRRSEEQRQGNKQKVARPGVPPHTRAQARQRRQQQREGLPLACKRCRPSRNVLRNRSACAQRAHAWRPGRRTTVWRTSRPARPRSGSPPSRSALFRPRPVLTRLQTLLADASACSLSSRRRRAPHGALLSARTGSVTHMHAEAYRVQDGAQCIRSAGGGHLGRMRTP